MRLISLSKLVMHLSGTHRSSSSPEFPHHSVIVASVPWDILPSLTLPPPCQDDLSVSIYDGGGPAESSLNGDRTEKDLL